MRGKVPDERQEGGAEAAAHAASRERARLEGLGAQEIGGAHVKHLAHVCDARSIEAQWLVECRRFLPSRKGGIPCGRGAGREAEGQCGGGGASSVQAQGRT